MQCPRWAREGIHVPERHATRARQLRAHIHPDAVADGWGMVRAREVGERPGRRASDALERGVPQSARRAHKKKKLHDQAEEQEHRASRRPAARVRWTLGTEFGQPLTLITSAGGQMSAAGTLTLRLREPRERCGAAERRAARMSGFGECGREVVPAEGIEPPTPSLRMMCSTS